VLLGLHQYNKNAPLSILSFNIEGFSANKLYLELLTRRSDIIFMQEHWIHSWGKREIEDFMDILDFGYDSISTSGNLSTRLAIFLL
jgi:hypothetical protein